MKKSYITPDAEKIEFAYRGQVVASTSPAGGSSCWWASGDTYSHAYDGCNENRVPGTNPHWVDDKG